MISELENKKFIEVEYNPFEEDEIEKIVSINESQREIWLSCVIGEDPASLAYNESVSLDLKGHFNFENFKKAFHTVVARHEALRSSISANGEKLIIYKNIDFNFELEDISFENDSTQKEILNTFLKSDMAKPIDLHKSPLFRTSLFKLDAEHHYFTFTIHHIICDGWSIGIIFEDLSKTYNLLNKGLNYALANCPQISTYALQQFDYLKSESFAKTESFWVNLFKNNTIALDFPTDFPRTVTRTYYSDRIDSILPSSLVSELKKIGAKSGSSLVNTMLSVFEIFLHQKTHQNEIVVGLPSSGQSATENYELVGHCVNLLPIKSIINPEIAFLDYLKERKKFFLDAFENQQISFGQLLKKLNFKRDSSRIPLVPIIFNIDMGMDASVSFDDLQYKLISNPRQCETFEIFLNATGSEENLILEWNYNTQLFKSSTIKKTIIEFETLVEFFINNPTAKIKDSYIEQPIKKNTKTEGKLVVNNESFIELFDKSVAQFPNKIAVSFNNEALSYKSLNTLVNQLSSFLIANNISVGDVVAIAADRSIKMFISLLAILKTGAAYLPLDPSYPHDRIEFMLEDSAAKTLLISKKYKRKYSSKATEFIIEDVWPELGSYDSNNKYLTQENNLAYLLYTSGSTGKPKGVKITHGNLSNFLTSMRDKPGIKSDDCLLAITTISFDIAGLELYLPLIVGAELIIADTESVKDGRLLLNTLDEGRVSIMQATPSTWQMMLDSGWNKKYNLKILTGGEALTTDIAEQLLNYCNELWNMYGPTETTIWSTIKHILPEDKTITIGYPINNTHIYIVDEFGNQLPKNELGEIYIGGNGVAEGYLNRAELTDEKFVKNNFLTNSSSKLYRTGDLGKIMENGEIQCLGRIDHQVKIRGHRIELGEIESVILKQNGVKQVVVIAREDSPTNKRLVAYLIVDKQMVSLQDTDTEIKNISENVIKIWKENLFEELPSYMVPDHFVALDSFPLTPNSKIDRKAFPKLKTISNRAFKERDLSVNESLIAKVWSEVLDVKDLKPSDDFFELGGHSLIAIRAMVAIEKETGIRLPLAILFDNSTIEKLAIQLSKDEFNENWNSIIAVKKSGNKPPLYIVHGLGMNILMLNNLVNEIDKEQPIFGIQPKGLNPNEEPFNTIEDIASEYVNELIKVNPNGPYLIMGYSAGGVIALEMVNQFQKIGKKVSYVALLDTSYSGPTYADMLGKLNFKEIFSLTFNSVKYACNFIYKEPRYYLRHNLNFTLGTLYNIYKKINPIKKDLSNPKYVLNKIQNAHLDALKKYKIKTINSDIHLFKAKEKEMIYIPNSESNGWKPYINGKLNIIDIPLEHLQFFDPQHVSILAQAIEKSLDEIEE